MLRSSTARSVSRGLSRALAGGRPEVVKDAAKSTRRSLATDPFSHGSSRSVGGGGKAVAITAMGVGGALAGTLGLAAFDRDFRRSVEDNVPGTSGVFSALLGDVEPEAAPPMKKTEPKLPVTSVPSKKRPVTPAPPTPKQSSSESSVNPEQTGEAVSSPGATVSVIPPLPPLEMPPSMLEAAEDSAKRDECVKEAKPEGESLTATTDGDDDRKEAGVQLESPIIDDQHRLLSKEDVIDLHDSHLITTEKDLHKRVSLIKEELEAQLIKQLKRQSQAHADHVTDSLDIQRKELTRQFMRELDEALEKAAVSHSHELSALVGHVRGLEEALKRRSEMEIASLEAQELWLACSSLLDAVTNGSVSSGELRSLSDELAAVTRVVERSKDRFSKSILDSIPSEAANRGIYTENSIKERFLRVEKVALRTALVGDKGASLITYFLSYLQSLLMLTPSTVDVPSKNNPVDLEALDTFDLVWLARASLDRGDLDQAVRYMSLLRGLPRNVARDWVREARLLLETRQACHTIMWHAASVGVEALPQRE